MPAAAAPILRVIVGTLACALAAASAGCHYDIGEVDSVFYAGGERQVHCAVDIDARTHNGFASIDSGLDRARDRGEVVEIYAHQPGVTVPVATLEHLVHGALDRGLTFYTYDDFARGGIDPGATGPGIALSFDDSAIDLWTQIRPLLAEPGVRVTFFVSRYHEFSDDGRAELRDLASDGHAIEAHTVNHLHAPDYVERYGLQQYMDEEAQPSIDRLVADGYDVQAFAYPFGSRTSELDRALLGRVKVLRSISYAWEPVESPCPE